MSDLIQSLLMQAAGNLSDAEAIKASDERVCAIAGMLAEIGTAAEREWAAQVNLISNMIQNTANQMILFRGMLEDAAVRVGQGGALTE